METQEKQSSTRCPKCGKTEHQMKSGFNRSGTQRCVCNYCKHKYTPSPKTIAIPGKTRQQAVKMYLEGNSARAVGRIFGFSKENVLNWIKKNG